MHAGLERADRPGVGFAVLFGPQAQAAAGVEGRDLDLNTFGLHPSSPDVRFPRLPLPHPQTIVSNSELEIIPLVIGLTHALREPDSSRTREHHEYQRLRYSDTLRGFFRAWNAIGQVFYRLSRPCQVAERCLEMMGQDLRATGRVETMRRFDDLLDDPENARELIRRIEALRELFGGFCSGSDNTLADAHDVVTSSLSTHATRGESSSGAFASPARP